MVTLIDKLRVVVVDDHPMFRDRLAQIINHEPDMTVCGEAGNAQHALETIQQTSPDLAIIDITLDGASGLELIKSIRALGLKISLLVLSMHDESLYAERALRAARTATSPSGSRGRKWCRRCGGCWRGRCTCRKR